MTSCKKLTLPLKTMSDPCVSITPRGVPLGPAGQRQEQSELQAAQHFSVAKNICCTSKQLTHTYAHTHTRTHIYINTYKHTNTHTHTHVPAWLRAVEMSTGYLYKGMTVVFSVILEQLVNGEQFVASCGGVWYITK